MLQLGEVLGAVFGLHVVGEAAAQRLRLLGRVPGPQVALGRSLIGRRLDHAGGAELGEEDLPRLDLAVVGRGGLGGAHQPRRGGAGHEGQPALVLDRQDAGPRIGIGGVDPDRGIARHDHDGMVEGAQAGEGVLDVLLVLARREESHIGGDVRGAQHGHQQHRLVLAVAELAPQDLGRGARDEPPFAQLDAGIADLVGELAQVEVHGLELRPGGTAGGAEEGLQVRALDRAVDDLGIAPRDLGPRRAGGEGDVGRPGRIGRQAGLGGRDGRELARLEGEAPPAAGRLLAGRRCGREAGDPTQRRAGGRFQDEAGEPHRQRHGQGVVTHGPAVEERRRLADHDLLLDDGPGADRRQRRAQDAAVLEHVGRLGGLGVLRDGRRIERVLGSVGGDHARPHPRPLLVPGRPALLDRRPALVRRGAGDAVDQPVSVGLAARLVVFVARLGEQNGHPSFARRHARGGLGHGGRGGAEDWAIPGLAGRSRAAFPGERNGDQDCGEDGAGEPTAGGANGARHGLSFE